MSTDTIDTSSDGSFLQSPECSNDSKVGRFDNDLLLRLLRCQSEVLGHITRKASTDATFSPIFTAAQEQLSPFACGIEIQSPRSGLVYHLAQQGLPKSFVQQGARHPLKAGKSLGALCIAEGQTILVPNLKNSSKPLSDELRDQMLETEIQAMWALPVPDDEGTVLGALTFYFDRPFEVASEDWNVVEFMADMASHAVIHRLSRQAKKVADSRFDVLADAIPGVVYQRIVTPDNQIRYTYISDAAEDLFGVSAREILEDPNALFDCHGEGYRENFRERLLEASRKLEIWDVEATIAARDGTTKFTHAIAKPLKQADGTVVWNGVILDATRIKEAEMEAAAAEARTRQAIVENLNQGFVLFDAEDRLIIANSKLRSYYPDLIAKSHPGTSLEDFLAAEHAACCGDDENCSTAIGESLSGVEERSLPDGSWLLVQTHKAEGGETVILYTEISELKEREAALGRSNRELQDFASVASHDLQEPLRKIEAFGDRLASRCEEQLDEQGQLYLERMLSAAGRMRLLINDLLTYSRVTTKGRPFEPCNLDTIAKEVVSDLQVRIEETGAAIDLASLPTIDADLVQMRQLFQNIISNSLKYHKEGVPPKITIGGTVGDKESRSYCALQFADNGIGFEMRYADRIFSIFQRLHGNQEFEGTGIGLATCRKIVERHGGLIEVDSVVGEGSTFTVKLPVVQRSETTKSDKMEKKPL
ncbi:ATP-binding protein [Pelagibius sp. Alg239-R121]|uniref:ATP-binding protein n=1 Tax=Pelagibius sp. Alg239-R121 TaxID=2993448 RepID=UPI0024A65063|nr:ATP-binding protein [Pelagibius sp. Alg239-R121]